MDEQRTVNNVYAQPPAETIEMHGVSLCDTSTSADSVQIQYQAGDTEPIDDRTSSQYSPASTPAPPDEMRPDSNQIQDHRSDRHAVPDSATSQSGTTPTPATPDEVLPEPLDDILRDDRPDSVVESYWHTFVAFSAISLPPLTTWFSAFYVRQTINASNTLVIPEQNGWPPIKNNNNAIMVLQLLTTLSVIAIRDFFLRTYEIVKIRLRHRLNPLTLSVLSPEVGWWTLLHLICSRHHVPILCRLLATLRFLVLYMLLLLASFIWLMQINPKPIFTLGLGSNNCPVRERTDFTLASIERISTAMSKPAVALTWSTMFVRADLPGAACPFWDSRCGVFVLGPLSAPAVYDFVVMNFATYLIEFDILSVSEPASRWWPPTEIWEYSLNYTTTRSNSLELSMKHENSSSSTNGSSIIRALWRQFQANEGSLFFRTGYETVLKISMTNVTMLFSQNGTIIAVLDIGDPIPSPLNISELFIAYTAPLQNRSNPAVGLGIRRYGDSKDDPSARFVDAHAELSIMDGLFNKARWSATGLLAGAFALNTGDLVDNVASPPRMATCHDAWPGTVLGLSPAAFLVHITICGIITVSCTATLVILAFTNPTRARKPRHMRERIEPDRTRKQRKIREWVTLGLSLGLDVFVLVAVCALLLGTGQLLMKRRGLAATCLAPAFHIIVWTLINFAASIGRRVQLSLRLLNCVFWMAAAAWMELGFGKPTSCQFAKPGLFATLAIWHCAVIMVIRMILWIRKCSAMNSTDL